MHWQTDEKNNGLSVVDLFCGCGGLSYGFVRAGYNVVVGVDNDAAALNTFTANHGECNALTDDLSKPETVEKIRSLLGTRQLDVVIGGPPCQGFSLTGPRNMNDPRNRLYMAVVNSVRLLRPKAFLIENVPGLATLYGGGVKEEIIRSFQACGYSVSSQILCAADYGVPQIRKRLFFVGILEEYGTFKFPPAIYTPENYITCSQAICDLPTRDDELGHEEDVYLGPPQNGYQAKMRNGCSHLYNHVATKHTEYVKSVIAQVPEGGNYKDLPTGVGESRKFNEAWTRYHSQKPSRTIDTGHRNHFHYSLNRVPTIRENARLQSFPDSFIFYGTRTQQNRQVGNAVPPLLGYHIAKALQNYLVERQ